MPSYSHSRLETYQNCPRQYKLQYIDKPDVPEYESIEAFMGSRVHDTLEKLHKDLILSRLNTAAELEKYYQWAWDKEWSEAVKVVRRGFTKKHYFDTGVEAVRKYYRRYHPFNQSTTLATEQLVTFELEGYSLRGFIDRLAHNGKGLYEIHDYKAGGRLPGQEHFEQDRQLALYEIGVRKLYLDVRQVKLVWHYVVFDQEFTSSRTPAQLKDLTKQVVSPIKTIEKDEQFKPNESPLCGWCPYPDFCPAKGHELKVEALPPNKYLIGKGGGLGQQICRPAVPDRGS